jgi:hypothetical protein
VTESPGPSPRSETADEADVQEQAHDVTDDREADAAVAATTSLEVDEFDATEQARSVELDPDEYR